MIVYVQIHFSWLILSVIIKTVISHGMNVYACVCMYMCVCVCSSKWRTEFMCILIKMKTSKVQFEKPYEWPQIFPLHSPNHTSGQRRYPLPSPGRTHQSSSTTHCDYIICSLCQLISPLMLFPSLFTKIDDFSETPEASNNRNDTELHFKSPVTYIHSRHSPRLLA